MKKHTIQTAIALALLASSAIHAQDAVQWKVSDGGNGHWYQRVLFAGIAGCQECPQFRCQPDAVSFAVSHGAHLVSIGDISEGDFVAPINNCESCWLGLTLQGQDSCSIYAWAWSDGTPISPEVMARGSGGNWCTNYEFAADFRGGACGPWGIENLNSCWHDVTGMMLEFDTDCNSDGIVDYGQCRDGSLADINGNNIPDCCEAGADCAAASSGIGQCVVFARGTDTVHISGANTMLQGDYTIEWSGYLLNQAVVTNPPATVNARIWSEQDSVTEDKAVGINPNQTPWGWVNSPCYLSIQSPASLPVVTRAHVALVRLGGMVTMFVNGSAVSTAPQLCDPLNGGGSNMSLGAFVYVGQPSSNYWRAAPIALDWIRISGTSRYTSSFVPPQEPLVTDSSTQLLINFNGPNTWRDLANPGATLAPGSGVAGGTVPALATDCNSNGIPDQAELGMPGADLDGNGILDVCEQPTCHGADLYPNGRIDGADLGILLSEWGPLTPTTHSNINHDGVVNGADLGILLAYWGSCPN